MMSGAMHMQAAQAAIQNPSKLQKFCNKKIPDFLSEYVKKYGKDDDEKVYALFWAYYTFCVMASQSLDELVKSI